MKIGRIDIERPLLLAPMEDVTDSAFRRICKRLGADIVFTEFVNAEGLVRNNEKTHRKMLFSDDERPFGIQLYGGIEASMERAAEQAAELNPDIIDINCGCWVRNVVANGAGSALLKDIPRMESLVRSVVRAVPQPVTVKTRLGWDEGSIGIVEVAKRLEQTGIKALTIHCRTRSQAHTGEPDYSWIPKIKAQVSLPIVANGGLDSPKKIDTVFRSTGCDGVMIARGAIYNPWIFQQTKNYLQLKCEIELPSLKERIKLLKQHLQLAINFKGERLAIIEFRKLYSGYFKGLPNSAELRKKLMECLTYDAVERILEEWTDRSTSEQLANASSGNAAQEYQR